MSFRIKQGDTVPALRVSLLNGTDNAISLDGASVRFHMRAIGSLSILIDSSVSVIDAGSGVIQYDWVAGDTSLIGSYQAEFQVTYADGKIETFPNSEYISVEIIDDIS